MSVTPSSIVVGVFRDYSAAEQAVNALHNSGFGQEQIRYMVPGTSGGFLEGLKSFFAGTNVGDEDLFDDLTALGLSERDAEYYANEYNNGKPILIVRVAERGTEALNVLRQYGAYNTQAESSYMGDASDDTQPSAAYTQSDSSTADMPPSGEYGQQSSYGAPGQHDNLQDLETQSQAQTGEEYPYDGVQPGNATPDYDLSNQDTQIITPPNTMYAQDRDTSAPDAQADTSTPAADARDHYTDYSSGSGDYVAAQSSGTVSETETPDSQGDVPTAADYQTAQTTGATLAQDTNEQSVQSRPVDYVTNAQNGQAGSSYPGTGMADQVPQADSAATEQDYSSQTDEAAVPDMTGDDSQTAPATASQTSDMQPSQSSAASPEQMDELQQLQAQLQTLQQQLQEAKDRLAAAKEQENQIRTTREREQQLQSARQQLQDVQAELQATLAEYQEVQSRIGQYQ